MITETISEWTNSESFKIFSDISITQKEYEEAKQKLEYFPYYDDLSKNIIIKCCYRYKSYFLCAFSNYVKIVKTIVNEDGTTEIIIEYNDGGNNTERKIPKSMLSERNITSLFDFNIMFDEKYKSDLVKYLIMSQKDLEVARSFSKIGWKEIDGILVFDSFRRTCERGYWDKCDYNGSFDLQPKGTLEKWEETVKKEVCGNTPLEFVLSLGFASPVLALLNRSYDLGSIVFHLTNLTSTGKTTAAMLAVSVFSNPLLGEGTLISYNATQNYLLAALASCNGFTVAIDEVGTSDMDKSKFSKFLYSACSGKSKGRLNGDSTQKKSEHYSSFIISTAEYNLLTDNSEGGLKSRVFEIDDTLTCNSKNSVAIKETVKKNYAVAGEEFVCHFLKKHYENYMTEYKEIIKELKAKVKKTTPITDRIISNFAVILLTVKCCNDCEEFHFQFDYDKLSDYSVKQIEKASVSHDPQETVLEIVQQEVVKNRGYYPDIEENYFPSTIRGIVKKDKKKEFYYMAIPLNHLYKIYQM
ncbi:MAG: DUF927 domain-containing protein [Eubacterium sp.]|nr:DUF927 domain-containing protein [Eubacterium sp.]